MVDLGIYRKKIWYSRRDSW